MHNPIAPPAQRTHTAGDFAREEVGLANRNSGLPLEALRYDVTPVGMHFLLTHFDVPFVAPAQDWRLDIAGRVRTPLSLSLADIQQFPAKTLRVTLECAGNGRANLVPRWQTQPWEYGAVSTAEWTGTPLRHLLEQAGLAPDAADVAFLGSDSGFDAGKEHNFGRSLKPDVAMNEDVLVVWGMNGAPLTPQHGLPLRLVVPGWYGMASVKWLKRIEVLTQPFDGYQQTPNYHYRQKREDPGVPVSTMRVKSLMAPPGIPDWYTRHRTVEAGPVELTGRAWSGSGVPIVHVAVGIDGTWRDAALDPPQGKYVWRGWRFVWQAEVKYKNPLQDRGFQRLSHPRTSACTSLTRTWQATRGEHVLECRATDANGDTQPLEAPWDNVGFGNNGVQRVAVTVR